MNDIINEPFSWCIFCHIPTSRHALCGGCARQSGVEAAWCVGERREGLKRALDAYKFERVRSAAATFATLLDDTLPVLEGDWVVTAVPTAASHVRARGYDHAELIARMVAKRRGLPYQALLARRGDQTQHFAKGRKQRHAIAHQAFSAHGKATKVLLIDDIVTTGATIQAVTEVLRSNGTEHIAVAVISRQPLDEMAHL